MPKLNAAMKKAAGTTKMGGAGETKARDLHYEPVLYPRVNADDVSVLAIDPGEHHVGLAVGCRYFVEVPFEGSSMHPHDG